MSISFKLDKSVGKAMSVTEADKNMNDFNTFTVEQKFEIANMLIAIAYSDCL